VIFTRYRVQTLTEKSSMHPLSANQIFVFGLLVDVLFLTAVVLLGVAHVLPPEAVVGFLGTVSGARAVSRGGAGFPGPPTPPRAAGLSPGLAPGVAGRGPPTLGSTSGVGALLAALRTPVVACGRWVRVLTLALPLCLASCRAEPPRRSAEPPASPPSSAPVLPVGPIPAESCTPGPVPFVLVAGLAVAVTGSTSLPAADDLQSFCGDTSTTADAPDVVYAFTLPEEGVLRAAVRSLSPSFNPAMYLRLVCSLDFACFDFGDTREVIAGHFPAGTYFFVIDGSSGSGAFELEALFNVPFCGDGVVSPGEACDVGPGQRGDGCGDPERGRECQLEPAGMDDVCPGTQVIVPLGVTIVHGSTIGYANDYSGSLAIPPGGRDRVYQVTPAATGWLEVSIGLGADGVTDVCAEDFSAPGCWDRALYARTSCADPATEVDYSDNWATDVESISVPVTFGDPVFVFVDGYDDATYSSGPFDLRFELQ
jgi:cysteine-rich repeat protein